MSGACSTYSSRVDIANTGSYFPRRRFWFLLSKIFGTPSLRMKGLYCWDGRQQLNNSAGDWRRAILNRRMLTCIFTGLASGMPLYVLFQLVPVWLSEGGVSLVEIGLFALVGLPYTWKFLWAPLMAYCTTGSKSCTPRLILLKPR